MNHKREGGDCRECLTEVIRVLEERTDEVRNSNPNPLLVLDSMALSLRVRELLQGCDTTERGLRLRAASAVNLLDAALCEIPAIQDIFASLAEAEEQGELNDEEERELVEEGFVTKFNTNKRNLN